MNEHWKDLVNGEIARLIASAKICMVSNTMLNWPLSHQSMQNQWFDQAGIIWFLFIKTDISSTVFENGRMEVFYANARQSMFMSLSGEATVVERDRIPSHQSFPFMRTLENEALASTLGIVKFEPVDVYTWNDDAQNMVPIMLKGEMAPVLI
jgi:hypothetical protein